MMNFWEQKPKKLSEIEHFDVAVVLGGGIIDDYRFPYDRVHFDGSSDRLLQALQLYRTKKVSKILISAGSISSKKKIKVGTEAELSSKFLISEGIPKENILVENKSRNTFENAVFTRKILEENQLEMSKIVLITSAFHMKRSELCFKKQNIRIQTFPSDFQGGYINLLSFESFIPDEVSFSTWYNLFHEWYGIISYKMMGYI